MISLTRLSGTAFLLNADLIERVDCTPDTVVTLVDGTKYLVSESLGEVLESVVRYRASIVAYSALPEAATLPTLRPGPVRASRLAAVPPAVHLPIDRGGTP
ncbi:flagellar FlbD family protein [Nocardioides caeni]|uniref:Flagellar protein FlbD n=1 Tax=Nocardioides caeni TaxID=574700 RepID=A0A4S8NFM1_9ACTN|nr:flagellar FlbD family protein [Nocardioides caeni]THV14712.1 flagellar protein FlbD [Nocardioides caeni]